MTDAPQTLCPHVHRRSIIEEAKLCYEAHWGQMLVSYPHLRMTPWDDQDAAVREAWIEHVLPDEDERIARLANEVSRRDAVLDWIERNVPQAIELCPYKLVRGD